VSPAAANRSPVARPIPPAPPVISTTLDTEPRPSARDAATVDGNRRAGDVGGFIAGQEEHCASDLIR